MIIVNRDSNQPKLSADTEIGGSLGSEAQETQLSLLKTTIADEIKDTLHNKKSAPSEESVEKFIAAFIPSEKQSASHLREIQDQLNVVVRLVRANTKTAGENIPVFSAALDIAIRMAESGLLASTELSNAGVSLYEKALHLLKEDESIRERLGRFESRSATSSSVVVVTNLEDQIVAHAEDRTEAEMTNSRTRTNESAQELTLYESLGQLAGISAERLQNAFALAELTPSDIEDLTYFTTGTDGKRDSNGELIVLNNSPYRVSLTGMITLLEEGYSKGLVLVMAQLKRLLDINDEVVLGDLIEDEELQQMTEADFIKKVLNAPGALEPEIIASFCTEFGYDLDRATITKQSIGKDTKGSSVAGALDLDSAEEIASGLLLALSKGEGVRLDQKIQSFIDVSIGHPQIRGDVSAVAELFD